MAYKGKPLIINNRPWWRHPIFPWGWYSLKQDRITGHCHQVSGHDIPGDGGGGLVQLVGYTPVDGSGVTIYPPADGGGATI